VEKILPNVYAGSGKATSASATVEFESNGSKHTVVWQDGAPRNSILQRFVAFDSRAARSYLNEKNVVTVMPAMFAKLELLTEVTRQVKQRLLDAAEQEQPDDDFLDSYIDDTAIGEIVENITSETPKKTLENAFVWTDDDEASLTDFDKQHAKLKSQGPLALRQELQQRRSRTRNLAQQLNRAEALISTDKIAIIQKQQELCKQRKQQKDAAAKAALGKSLIEGVGTTGWEELLQAAAAFFASEVEPRGKFPGTVNESVCVLCQQVLEPEAHERLKKFWSFLQDDAAQKLTTAQNDLAALLKPLDRVPDSTPDDLLALEDDFKKEIPAIWKKATKHFEALAVRRDAVVKAAKSGAWDTVPGAPVSLAELCEAEVQRLNEKEGALNDAKQAAAELESLAGKVKGLTARKHVAKNRGAILKHHDRLVRAKALNAAAGKISTNVISLKITALQKKYVTEEFSDQVRSNAQTLGLTRAVPSINTRTEAGKFSRSVVIDGIKHAGATPEQVFSEGERTALALAYFLAELGDATVTPGVVFDDPVTSLDHSIRSNVVTAIVALAKTRQVIVFTHDLAFYCELKEQATITTVPFEIRSIDALGPSVGIVRSGEPIDAMGIGDREKLLQEWLKTAQQNEQASDIAAFDMTCHRFYGLLRSTWERSIEELLFNKVVSRFDKAVKTLRLTGAVIDADAIAAVFGGMTKCSDAIDAHDHAAAVNTARPTCQKLKEHLSEFQSFRDTQRKKLKTQDAQLAYLKP